MWTHEDEHLGQGWWLGGCEQRVSVKLEDGAAGVGQGQPTEDPAARLGLPGRYFVQAGETAGLTRAFLLFLHPLQCVPPVLRCSATSSVQPQRHQHEEHTPSSKDIIPGRAFQLR